MARRAAVAAAEAGVTALLTYIGVNPETARRLSRYIVKYLLIAIPVVLMFGLIVVIGLMLSVFGTNEVRTSTAYDNADPAVRQVVEQAAKKYNVPKTLLMGIAQTQTRVGEVSPYEASPRQSANVPYTVYPTLSPAIGDPDQRWQGLGPYLLRGSAAESAGIDPQNWSQSSELVALLLRRAADSLIRSGIGEPTSVAAGDAFWSQAVNMLPLVDPVTGGAGCSANTADIGSAIQRIWNCELLNNPVQLYVVEQLPGGAYRTYTLGADESRGQLVSEALAVAWQWANVRGSVDTWADVASLRCSESDALAGVFPLTRTTATAHGAKKRCDVSANISAAVKAVIADLSVEPPSNPDRPFSPSTAGWSAIPWALGNGTDLQSFLINGPWSAYAPGTECENIARNWISALRSSSDASVFERAATSGDLAAVEDAWRAYIDTATGAPRGNAVCADPMTGRTAPADRYLTWLAEQASTVVELAREGSAVSGLDSYPEVKGLIALADKRSERTRLARASGTPALPRLSIIPLELDTPFVQPDTLSGSGIGARAVGAAILFGGLVPGDDRSGTDPYGLGGGISGSTGGIGIAFWREDPNQKPLVPSPGALTPITCGTAGIARYALPALDERWKTMCTTAKVDGVMLTLNSAWRSHATQIGLSETNPPGTAAAPGTSPHEKGAAIDVDTGSSFGVLGDARQQYAWLHSIVGCFDTSARAYTPLPEAMTRSQYVALLDQGRTPCGRLWPVKRAQTFGLTPLCLNHYNQSAENWSDRAVIMCLNEPMKGSSTGFHREAWHFDIGIIVATTGIATASGADCALSGPLDPTNKQSVAAAIKSLWQCRLASAGLDRVPPRSAYGYDASWADNLADQVSSEAVLVAFCESGFNAGAGAQAKYRGLFQMGEAELKAAGADPALWADIKVNTLAAATYWLNGFATPGSLEGWRPWAVVNTQWYGKENPVRFPVIGRFLAQTPSPEAGSASGTQLPNWAQEPNRYWGPTGSCGTSLALGKDMPAAPERPL